MSINFQKSKLREKCASSEIFQVRLLPYADWIGDLQGKSNRRIQLECGKNDQKKLRIQTLFTQWHLSIKQYVSSIMGTLLRCINMYKIYVISV